MATAVGAHDLGTLHEHAVILVPRHGTRNSCRLCELRPSRLDQPQHIPSKNAGHPHPAFFVVSNILYASSGWINVLLWSITGRQFGFTSASTKVRGGSRRGTRDGSGKGGAKGFERVARDEHEDGDGEEEQDAFELDLEGWWNSGCPGSRGDADGECVLVDLSLKGKVVRLAARY